jgi:Leucine-rich repeat (LRR) protein
MTNLQQFDCSYNKLTSLPSEISKLINLRQFDCSHNKLTNLPSEIGQLINLQQFDCSHNKLTNLPSEIGKHKELSKESPVVHVQNLVLKHQLINLRQFDCSHNKLTNLPSEIGQLVNLRQFDCSHNELTSLPSEIGQLVNLRYFYHSNNEIEYIPPNIQRLLDRLYIGYANSHSIYNDTQSIHNHNIQECIRKSISYVMSQKPTLNNEELIETITENKILNKTAKQLLFEYMENTDIHSVIGVTFNELLLNVISLTLKHKHKNEILSILNIEMQESEYKCFTGRMSRLVNCLNGFDPNIQIKIADNEQIANVILQTKKKYFGKDIEIIKAEVNKRLMELDYDKETIDSWTEHIDT